jgi:UDP-glucose:(heptosyl)LPS alpha-1,3-glucosyltransferase
LAVKNKILRIALIRQRFAQDGGAERFVARMLEALKGRDVRITLITREWQAVEGVSIITLKPFYLGRLWRDWSFARAVCRLLQTRHFDLVQSHERIACCDIYRAGDGVHREWLRQLARVRGPLGRLGLAINPYHLYVRWAEKRLFASPQLKAVICNSQMVKEEIRHYFGAPEEKLHVIYNGVDTEVFHPRLKEQRAEIRARYGIPDNATLFLFVGSGFERKGVAVLLEAMAKLPADACLLIVGRDKRSAKYERRARALGLAGRVCFAGSQADVRPYYGAADALVLPTLYDPYPNVIPEAMASGLAVVTSTKSGAAELLGDGGRGFACDALDTDRLAACLEQLMGDVSTAMGSAARRALEAQTLESMGARLSALYRKITTVPA